LGNIRFMVKYSYDFRSPPKCTSFDVKFKKKLAWRLETMSPKTHINQSIVDLYSA